MPSRVTWIPALIAALVSCQEQTADLLAEFPPPRLASEAPQTMGPLRHTVLPGSQAVLSSTRGRTPIASWYVEPRGWLERTETGRIGAGELTLSLSEARLELAPGTSLTGTSFESLTDPTLRLRWSASVPTTESGEQLRAQLELNRHRSEVPLSFRREARSRQLEGSVEGGGEHLRSTPIAFSPGDHALQLWGVSEQGASKGPLDGARLELSLIVGSEPAESD